MRIIITVLLIVLSINLFSQVNLIPNFSFEDTVKCPTNISQITSTKYWISPTVNTPDYFNQCCPPLTPGPPPPVGVPNNEFGSESAHTGVAYAGIWTFDWYYLNNRDYIQAPLLDTLQANKKYCVEFYVSLADIFMYATNNVGAYFSDSAISRNDYYNFTYTPQIENKRPNMLTDYKGWTRVSGIFVAGGGEICYHRCF